MIDFLNFLNLFGRMIESSLSLIELKGRNYRIFYETHDLIYQMKVSGAL